MKQGFLNGDMLYLLYPSAYLSVKVVGYRHDAKAEQREAKLVSHVHQREKGQWEGGRGAGGENRAALLSSESSCICNE